MQCGVCGGREFQSQSVLWNKLIEDWQLSQFEVEYVNRQQGKRCTQCGANLRSIALANALRSFLRTTQFLNEAVLSPVLRELSVLEINEAGSLTPYFKSLERYQYCAYPEVDMHSLPYEDHSFNVVIHSDTLEHIRNPIHALSECCRVIKPGGALCFTVPVIVGRLTRTREGLPQSFHGDPANPRQDYVVHTEFGADAWTYLFEAGFSDISMHAVEYPAALAFVARVSKMGTVMGASCPHS
jgi:SAM-dependent methyltransferase